MTDFSTLFNPEVLPPADMLHPSLLVPTFGCSYRHRQWRCIEVLLSAARSSLRAAHRGVAASCKGGGAAEHRGAVTVGCEMQLPSPSMAHTKELTLAAGCNRRRHRWHRGTGMCCKMQLPSRKELCRGANADCRLTRPSSTKAEHCATAGCGVQLLSSSMTVR